MQCFVNLISNLILLFRKFNFKTSEESQPSIIVNVGNVQANFNIFSRKITLWKNFISSYSILLKIELTKQVLVLTRDLTIGPKIHFTNKVC